MNAVDIARRARQANLQELPPNTIALTGRRSAADLMRRACEAGLITPSTQYAAVA